EDEPKVDCGAQLKLDFQPLAQDVWELPAIGVGPHAKCLTCELLEDDASEAVARRARILELAPDEGLQPPVDSLDTQDRSLRGSVRGLRSLKRPRIDGARRF